jgi:hypothetical protein
MCVRRSLLIRVRFGSFSIAAVVMSAMIIAADQTMVDEFTVSPMMCKLARVIANIGVHVRPQQGTNRTRDQKDRILKKKANWAWRTTWTGVM